MRQQLRTPTYPLYLASAALALLGGAYVAHSHSGEKLVGLLAAIVALAFFGRIFGRGGVYALLILGAFNLVPGMDTSTHALHGGFFVSDVCVYGLAAAMFLEEATSGFEAFRSNRVVRWLGWWGVLMFVAWALNVIRSWAFDGAVLLHAVRYGEYLLYFSLLTPLCAAALTDPVVRRNVVLVLGTYAGVIAAALTVSNLHSGGFQFLLHSVVEPQQFGDTIVNRTYALSAGLFSTLALPFGLGVALLRREPRARAAGALVATFCATATLTGLTRAQYIGLAADVMAPLTVWLLWTARGERVRERVGAVVVLLAAVAVLFIVINPPSVANSSLSVVTDRISSIPQTLFSSNAASSTVAYRAYEERVLEGDLGSDWPIGLGYLDPRDHFFVGLPTWDDGSIEDTDVGLLNTVMTTGVIGLIIQALPVLGVLTLLVIRRARGRMSGELGWIAFGGVGAFTALVVTSVTQVFLFEPTTIVMCAVAIAVAATAIGPDGSVEPAPDRPDGSVVLRPVPQ